MTDETVPENAPAAVEPAIESPALSGADRKGVENEFHRLVYNGLHIFGKLEQWTAEEIEKFATWLKASHEASTR